jgi:hypothetical protein
MKPEKVECRLRFKFNEEKDTWRLDHLFNKEVVLIKPINVDFDPRPLHIVKPSQRAEREAILKSKYGLNIDLKNKTWVGG